MFIINYQKEQIKVARKCIHKILKDVTIDCGKYFLYDIDYFYIVDQK
jgi:hypothetical protein